MTADRIPRRRALQIGGLAVAGFGLGGCATRDLIVEVSGTAPAGRRQVYHDVAQLALPSVQQVWGKASLPEPVRIIAPGGAVEWAELSAVDLDTTDVPAVVTQVGGKRAIVVNPAAYGRLDAIGKRILLTHEGTHLAQESSDAMPWWLSEGSAELTAYSDIEGGYPGRYPAIWADVAASLAPEAVLPQQPTATTAVGLGQSPRTVQYASAWTVCEWMKQTSQEADVVPEVYRAVARGDSWSTIVLARWGMSPAQMTEAWAAWVADQASAS